MTDKQLLEKVSEETTQEDQEGKERIWQKIDSSVAIRSRPKLRWRFVLATVGVVLALILIAVSVVAVLMKEDRVTYCDQDLISEVISVSTLTDLYPHQIEISGYELVNVQLYVSKLDDTKVYIELQYVASSKNEWEGPWSDDSMTIVVFLVKQFEYVREGEYLETHNNESIVLSDRTINFRSVVDDDTGVCEAKAKFTSGKYTFYISASYFKPYTDEIDLNWFENVIKQFIKE